MFEIKKENEEKTMLKISDIYICLSFRTEIQNFFLCDKIIFFHCGFFFVV